MDQILRDAHNHIIGKIEDRGSYQAIRDEHNHLLGKYDGKKTYDEHNYLVGEGNLLVRLLH